MLPPPPPSIPSPFTYAAGRRRIERGAARRPVRGRETRLIVIVNRVRSSGRPGNAVRRVVVVAACGAVVVVRVMIDV